MADDERPAVHEGERVGARIYTLREACDVCGAELALTTELVTFGVVSPSGAGPGEWVFSGLAVLRLQKAVRLHRDLGINPPGLALVLDLLDEVERLRRLAHPHR
jgi:chaperone modulatory protein CbpM